ncbi:Esterase YbfF, partial [Haemophilus influenzae]
KINRN